MDNQVKDFVKIIYQSNHRHLFLRAFGLFSILVLGICFCLPSIKLGILDKLGLISFLAGCFLQFGTEIKKFIKSLTFFAFICLSLEILTLVVLWLLEGRDMSLFKEKNLGFTIKMELLLFTFISIPPLLGFGSTFLIRKFFDFISSKKNKSSNQTQQLK